MKIVFVALFSFLAMFSSCQNIKNASIDNSISERLEKSRGDMDKINELLSLDSNKLPILSQTEYYENAELLFQFGCNLLNHQDTLALRLSRQFLLKIDSTNSKYLTASNLLIYEYCILRDFNSALNIVEHRILISKSKDLQFKKALILLKLNREDSAKRILFSFISSEKSDSNSDIEDIISNHIIKYLITNDKDNLVEIQRLAKIHPDNIELYILNQDILNINNRDDMIDNLLGIDNSQQISSVEND